MSWASTSPLQGVEAGGQLQRGVNSLHVNKVHPLQLFHDPAPTNCWAQLGNDAVDAAGKQAALTWHPEEKEPWEQAFVHYEEQKLCLQHLIFLHLASARAYTGGSSVTNRPQVEPSLPVPDRPTPPSLMPSSPAPRAAAKRPCTLDDLWDGGAPPQQTATPFSWRLSQVPMAPPTTLEERLCFADSLLLL